MSNLFTDLLDQGIIVFLDDELVYSHNRDEYVQLLCTVFHNLHEHRFYCKLKKCSIFLSTTTFLGFDITPDGLKISEAKAKSLCDWLLPMTIK